MDNGAREIAGEAEDAGAAGSVPLPKLLRRFWVWSAVVFGLTLTVAWVEFRAGFPRNRWDPLAAWFLDLNEYPGTYKLLHTAAFFFNVQGAPLPYPLFSPVAYPPFAAVVMAPLYASVNPGALFLAVSAVWLALCVWGVRRALIGVGINAVTATLFPLTLTAMSFPIARLVHQGNIELVLWIFAAAGVWAFLRGHGDAAAVLWGLAAAMKLFPVVLLLLLLPRRRYRAFAVGVGTFVAATVGSLWWLGPTVGVAWRGSLKNVFGYQGTRVSEWSLHELAANHSALGLVKLAAIFARFPLARLTLPYYVCGALVLALAFFGRLWRMPVANQLLALSVFMVAFPPVSYFHALVHLYAPLLVLLFVAIRAQQAGVRVRGLGFAVMLFVPLFASWTLFTFVRVWLFAGLLQACILVALFLCALEVPFGMEIA
jgi:hypothetical protein